MTRRLAKITTRRETSFFLPPPFTPEVALQCLARYKMARKKPVQVAPARKTHGIRYFFSRSQALPLSANPSLGTLTDLVTHPTEATRSPDTE